MLATLTLASVDVLLVFVLLPPVPCSYSSGPMGGMCPITRGTSLGLTMGCLPCLSLPGGGNTCWAHPWTAWLVTAHSIIPIGDTLLGHLSNYSTFSACIWLALGSFTPFLPATFLSEIILSDYNISTQKSIGLVQNRCLCKSHLYPSTPVQSSNIATPVSTFPLRRWLPDWTLFIRANFSSNWQEGAWLCYCLWGESCGQVHRLGERQRESAGERERVCSSSSPMRESITQPCLCFPNSFWFSRKSWAKLQCTNIHQSLDSPRGLSQTCTYSGQCVCACSCLWKCLKVCLSPILIAAGLLCSKQKYKCLWKGA